MGNIIVAFKGNTSNIPAKWWACDGTNGTPDLRDKFVKGTPDNANILAVGGALTHSHTTLSGGSAHDHGTTSTGTKHSHQTYDGSSSTLYYVGQELNYVLHNHSSGTGGSSHTHSSNSASNMPKYYKLIFIMAEAYSFNFPINTIVMFNGLVDDLPENWAFCDGTNGTPDLRNKFIRGANDFGEVGSYVSSSTHTHSVVSSAAHTHTLHEADNSHRHSRSSSGNDYRKHTDYMGDGGYAHTHTVSGAAGSHTHTVPSTTTEPPYVKLAYIKKIA